ncbi:hypothetical protein TcYC6_0078330 [Trypanosoma cruzi]|nr:hypothetical protein TcYC6_0078330 [Trypanosoma cruzi]
MNVITGRLLLLCALCVLCCGVYGVGCSETSLAAPVTGVSGNGNNLRSENKTIGSTGRNNSKTTGGSAWVL